MGALGNLFNRLFGSKAKKTTEQTKLQALNIFTPNFSNEAKAEFNANFVAAVNAYGDFLSKVKPQVYRNDAPAENEGALNRILSLKPNPIMNAAQFYKAIGKAYKQDNLVLIWPEFEIDKAKGQRQLKALWPLDIDTVNTATTNDGRIVLEFAVGGKKYYKYVEDIIVLRRDSDIKKLFGGRSEALKFTLKAIQASYEGLEQAIRMSQYIRFIVKSATLLSEDAIKERQKEFADRLIGHDGLLYVSGSEEIKEVTSNGKWPLASELDNLKSDIYEYLGITKDIVKGDYKEEQWQSFYERSIEPFTIELAQELTLKLFTVDEINRGKNIRVVTSPLQTASLNTRIKIAEAYQKLPLVVPNVVCDLLYLPLQEGGDKPQASLAWVQSDKQNEYQGVSKPKKEEDDDE